MPICRSLIAVFLHCLQIELPVDAIINIKSNYKLKRHWQGDPCFPEDHIWDGLNCSYNGSDPPRIISL